MLKRTEPSVLQYYFACCNLFCYFVVLLPSPLSLCCCSVSTSPSSLRGHYTANPGIHGKPRHRSVWGEAGGRRRPPCSPFSHKTQPVVVRSPNKYVLDIERETTQTRMVIMDTSDAHVDAICEERSRSRPFLRRRFEPKQSAPASSFFRLQRSSALADWRIRSVVEAHIARQNLLVELRRCHH